MRNYEKTGRDHIDDIAKQAFDSAVPQMRALGLPLSIINIERMGEAEFEHGTQRPVLPGDRVTGVWLHQNIAEDAISSLTNEQQQCIVAAHLSVDALLDLKSGQVISVFRDAQHHDEEGKILFRVLNGSLHEAADIPAKKYLPVMPDMRQFHKKLTESFQQYASVGSMMANLPA
jgi:hypothetical protein